MKPEFLFDFVLVSYQSFRTDVDEQEFWDLAFAHAALELKVGIFFLQDAVHYLLKDKASSKTLQALPLYGIDKVYVVQNDLKHHSLSLADLCVRPEVLEENVLSSYFFTAKHLVHWRGISGCHDNYKNAHSEEPPITNKLADNKPAQDKYGYLLKATDWNKAIAETIAAQEHIILDQKVWQVIEAMRTFYHQYQMEPTMRAFIAFLKEGAYGDLGNSIMLHRLFPGGVLKQVCKIAGLPRPVRCFSS